MKKKSFAAMFTLRKDGRYMGYYHELDREGKPTGRRHAVYSRDPEALYRRIQDLESGTGPVTFEQLADTWAERHFERIASKTAEAYTAPVRRLKAHFAGPAADVTAAQIQAYLVEMGKSGYARRTVQMSRDVLNMIFNAAILDGVLTVNPCAAVSLPRNLPSTKRELPEDTAIEAVKNGAGEPFGLFALICLYAGLRRGEVLALRYEDIDRAARLIHVDKAVEYVGNDPKIKAPKTAAGVRDVPLLQPLADAIPEGRGLIFCREDGKPLTKIQYRKRWQKYCAAIGCDITAHQLRHGYATLLFEAGIPDKDAQELLGHSSIQVTRDIYTHIRSTRRQETADRLNAFVVGGVVKSEKN